MQNDRRSQARAIAIAKTADERFRKIEIIAFAVTMMAACLYGFMAFIL